MRYNRSKLRLGDWNAICDVCGWKYKASELMPRWDGLMVCRKDWETRHPQDRLHPIKDSVSVPWTRPDVTPTFPVCTISGTTPIPEMAIPGCAIPG